MNKGLIVCGYPGVGKSSIAGRDNCIDLESSIFSHNFKGEHVSYSNAWYKRYCLVAIELASQGYTVLTSTHETVIDTFAHWDHQLAPVYKSIPKVIFCPRLDMKEQWIERLDSRYAAEQTEKDERAYKYVLEHFDDITHLKDSTLPCFSPLEINYDLAECIKQIREDFSAGRYPKDLCMNPDETEAYIKRLTNQNER